MSEQLDRETVIQYEKTMKGFKNNLEQYNKTNLHFSNVIANKFCKDIYHQ